MNFSLSTPRPSPTMLVWHYALAVAAALAAVGIRVALSPWFSEGSYAFLLPLAASVTVGAFTGLGPSLLALGVGGIASGYFLVPPIYSLAIASPQAISGLVMYLAAGLVCALLTGWLHRIRLGVQATEALATRQAQRLNETLESITDAFFTFDSEWRFTFINAPAAKRFGPDVLGRNAWEAVPEMVGTLAQSECARAMAQRVPLAYEFFLDAGQRWFRSKVYPTSDGGLAVYSQDITDFKNQSQALAASEAGAQAQFVELEAIYATAPIGICVLDRDLRFRRVNTNLAEINGVPAEAHIGKSIREVVPALADQAEELLRRVVHSGEAARFEMRGETPARPGVVRIWDEQWFALRAPGSDEITGICAVIEEITERKRADEELHARTQQLESLLGSAPIGLAFFDSSHRYLRVNKVLADINGLPADKHVGVSINDLLPGIGEVIGPVIDSVFRTKKPVRNETSGVTPSQPGVSRHWMTGFYPVFGSDGEVVMAGCWVIEITDRKRAEEALLGSEQRLQLAMSIARAGTWDYDFATDRSYWSESHFTLLGYPAPSGGGLAAPAMWFDLIVPEDLPRVRAEWAHAQSTHSVYNSEHRLRRIDNGAIVWLKAAGRFFHDDAGRPVRCVGAFFDVTALKETEQALIDADRRKDEFLATLAHELRNPLAPVRSSLQILRLGDIAPAESRRLLDMMDRQLAHMVRLVDDLLEVSRIASGKIVLRTAPLDLRAAVQSAIEVAQPLVAAGNHRLDIKLPEQPVLLAADAQRLAQVFANLLNNAAKYTDPGGRIEVCLRKDGDAAEVTVRDGGVGIPAEMLPRVFDLFTQVDRTLGRAQGGLGIGLSLVRSLVELHGGTVTASSGGAGQGSEFTVRLPLAGAQAAPADPPATPDAEAADPAGFGEAPAPPPVTPMDLEHLRIVVVDDNRDAAESLAMLLELLGASVRTVFSGRDALAALRAEVPDVLFLDLGMPEMDGYAVAREVRAEPAWNAVKLVALTGWGQSEDRQRTQDAGFDRHCVKPIDFNELTALLRELVPPVSV